MGNCLSATPQIIQFLTDLIPLIERITEALERAHPKPVQPSAPTQSTKPPVK